MTAKRVGDLALYVFAGLAISLAVVWYAWQSDGSGAESIARWAGLTGTTLILFGYAIRAHWRHNSRLSFWLVILTLLSVHLCVFVFALKETEHWKVLWFVLAYPLENIAIDKILSLTGHDSLVTRRR